MRFVHSLIHVSDNLQSGKQCMAQLPIQARKDGRGRSWDGLRCPQTAGERWLSSCKVGWTSSLRVHLRKYVVNQICREPIVQWTSRHGCAVNHALCIYVMLSEILCHLWTGECSISNIMCDEFIIFDPQCVSLVGIWWFLEDSLELAEDLHPKMNLIFHSNALVFPTPVLKWTFSKLKHVLFQ